MVVAVIATWFRGIQFRRSEGIVASCEIAYRFSVIYSKAWLDVEVLFNYLLAGKKNDTWFCPPPPIDTFDCRRPHPTFLRV